MKNKISVNVVFYENKLAYPLHISEQKSKNSIDWFIISDKIKSHMCTSNILTNLCLTKQKTKNTFLNIVYCFLAVKEFW